MHFPKICALNLLVCLPLLACTADKDEDTNTTPATATEATASGSTSGTAADTTDAETTATAPTTGSDTTEGAMTGTTMTDMTGATSDMTGATSDMTGATSDMTGATSDMSGSTASDDTTGDDTSTGEPGGLSYALDVHPVVIANACGCHANGVGGLTFTDAASAYAAWVNVQSFGSSLKRIEPGDPDKSYVLQKLLGNQINVGMGQNMPLGGPPLSQEKLDLFEQWILEGAAP